MLLVAAASADDFSDALQVILKEGGVYGAFIVLLVLALVALTEVLRRVIKALLKSKDDRLTDREQMTKTLTKVNDALKDQVIENNELATRLSLEATQSSNSVKECLKEHCQKFEKLDDAVDGLRQQQAILLVKLDK